MPEFLNERPDEDTVQPSTRREGAVAPEPRKRKGVSWWLKGVYALIGLAAAVLLADLIWGMQTGRELRAQVEAYRANGEPVFLHDFRTDVPPEENAAAPFMAAAAALQAGGDARNVWFWGWSMDEEPTEEQIAHLRAMLAKHASLLSEIRQAKGKVKADWGFRWKEPIFSSLTVDMSGYKDLSMLLGMAADLAHRAGDDRAAIQHAGDLLLYSRTLQWQPTLVGHLVGQGTGAIAADFVHWTAHELRLGATEGPGVPAGREQVEALIAALLDDEPAKDGYRRAMLTERAVQLEVARLIAAGRFDLGDRERRGRRRWHDPVKGRLIKPFMDRDALFMIRHSTHAMDAVPKPNLTAALEHCDFEGVEQYVKGKTHSLAATMIPPLRISLQAHFTFMTERRAAATLLAMRCYQVDHGRLPSSLEELVPRFLPAIPADPFRVDNGPFTFRVTEGGPIIYSIGENFTDEGGSEEPTKFGEGPSDRRFTADRVYRYFPPPRPASTVRKAGETEPEDEDEADE